MPQIKIRGINENQICEISEKMIDELIDAVKCPRDYFEIECIKSVAIRDGKIADVYPFVEVAWFDRGQEVQDTVAKIITDNIRENLNIESMDLAFTVFEMRVDKLLSNVGVASRAELKKYCKQGLISVNGKVINNPGVQVDSENDDVRFNGEKIVYREFVYIMLNKPDGYISATFDKYDPIVLDLIDQSYLVFEPFPVGRLDKDTEGLLVLTNDGQLAHRVLSPKKHVPKTYYAKIDGVVTEKDIDAFEKGVTLDDGYETMPSQLKILKSGEESEIELTIHEGKFHQVKRMFESVGKKVVYLKRLSMGKLKLDESLALGEYRELTEEEIKLIEER